MYSKKALRQQYEAMHSTYHKYGYRKKIILVGVYINILIDAYTVCIYVLLFE